MIITGLLATNNGARSYTEPMFSQQAYKYLLLFLFQSLLLNEQTMNFYMVRMV